MAKKITVKQIADACGVSPATVSRVINHNPLVKSSTVKLVEDTMLALGKPLHTSGNMNDENRLVIILNIPDFDNMFYQQIISGAYTSANAHKCDILVNQSPLDKASMPSFLHLIEKINAAGVILLNHISVDSLNRIHNIVPVVQCSEYNNEANLPFVSINNYASAKNATKHLLSIGRNKLAYINGPLNYKYSVERRRGFVDAMNEAGLSIPLKWMIQLPKIDYDMAYTAVTQLMDDRIIPNGFFCVSDTLAAAVTRAVSAQRLIVPDDVAVVGFDNLPLSTMTRPSLSTISQPSHQLGYTACEMVFDLINSGESTSKIFLGTELIVRESTTVQRKRG